MKLDKTGPIVVMGAVMMTVFLGWPYGKWETPVQMWLSIGRLAALAGYTLYAINFILSARWKTVEQFFAGLPRMYIFHHLTGVIAFGLILIHPLAIAAGYLAISTQAVINLILPDLANIPLTLGKLAWFLTMGILILTFLGKMEYDAWKKIHKFMGLGFVLAGLHAFGIGSTINASPILKIYLMIVTLAGIAGWGYRSVFGKWLVPKRKYRVEKVEKLTGDVLEIYLRPMERKIDYFPGQFIFIQPLVRGVAKEFHPFSLTSTPNQDVLSLGIKSVGDYTETLLLLKSGEEVLVEGPYGRFSNKFYPHPSQLWIAGGIGITPFVGMARNMDQQEAVIDLYYTVRNKEEAVYHKMFENAAGYKNFNYHFHDSSNQGRLTVLKISKEISNLKDREVFICGPGEMMKQMRKQLQALGVRNSRIHTEEFSLN